MLTMVKASMMKMKRADRDCPPQGIQVRTPTEQASARFSSMPNKVPTTSARLDCQILGMHLIREPCHEAGDLWQD